METRICRICKKEKPIDEFQLSHSGLSKPWRRHTCNSCESVRKQHYYNVNIEKIRQESKVKRIKGNKHNLKAETLQKRAEWQKNYRENLKKLVYAAYGNKCTCCGETEEKFLSLDHVHNDGYVARKQKLHPTDRRLYRYLISNNFPDDFQLLCMNCNFGKARNNGVCPHKERLNDYPEKEYTQAGGSAPLLS